MKWRLVAGLAPIAVMAFCGPVQADIYAFVDKNGIRNLSNVPNDPRYKLVMRTPAYRREAAQTTSSFAPGTIYGSAFRGGQSSYYARPSAWARTSRIKEEHRQRFAPDIHRIAAQNQLDPALLHAVISAESSYNPWAVSPKGAMGLMQLMPGTAARFGVANAYDPVANMQGGARYLRWLLDNFNDTRLAVAAYNAGEGAVQRYGNQIPPYRETQNYVVKVLNYYQQYKGNGFYNTASYAGRPSSSPLAYSAYNSGYSYYSSSYPSTGAGYLNRPGGVTVITPRANKARGVTGSATIPRTYMTPTGTQIIVGASGGASNSRARPPVVYSATPSGVSISTIRANLFAGNDK
ncbi:MAG: lytic transglycosylase domain-containing protein [Candidatus Competibacter sp.]|nr:lytic transglycosylase domain-containing protein [Candidatus Competibacter sp.]